MQLTPILQEGFVVNLSSLPDQDIRNQRRYRQHRKAELVKLRQTMQRLHGKMAFHEEQIDFYNQYIRTCLDNLAANQK